MSTRTMWRIKKGILNPRKVFEFAANKVKPLVRRVDRFAGVRLFGGTQRASNHLQGAYERRLDPGEPMPRISQKHKAIASAIETDGFTELGRIYDDSHVETTRETFETLLEERDYDYTERDPDGTVYMDGFMDYEVDMLEHFPEMKAVLTEDVEYSLLAYFGTWFKPVSIQMYRTQHIPDTVGSEIYSDFWHIDEGIATHKLKLFVYLTDVDEESGPFQTITTSETSAIKNQVNQLVDAHRHPPGELVEQEADTVEKFTGERGSAAFARTNVNLHRAGVPAEGKYRDIIQIVFEPAATAPPENWLEHPQVRADDPVT